MAIQIRVSLPAERTRYGRLVVSDDAGAALAGPFDCYGKADNREAKANGNKDRDPTKIFGDTPTGTYIGTLISPARTPKNEATYGPQSAIALDPQSGQAAVAKANGRRGLWIHGGALDTTGRLRPTFGCVRLANADMVAILGVIPKGALIDVTVTQA